MKRQSIGINALFLVPKDVGGTEYHLRSFLRELEEQDQKNEYVVFCNRENFETFAFTNPHWRKILCPVSARHRWQRLLYEQLILPLQGVRNKVSVLHSFGYFGPVFPLAKTVVTVHDANWRDHPEDGSWLQNRVLDLLIGISMNRAEYIVTDSAFSKKRLTHHFPAYRKKIKVLSPGVELAFLENLERATPHSKSSSYFLCVSAFYPHKNIPYLLALWEQIRGEFPSHKLVLVGKNGSDERYVLNLLQSQKRVTYYPTVSFSRLASLYKGATAFIHPSTYEGFGYPVYESLAAGLPTFVGKKELYNRDIQAHLMELSGNRETDSRRIVSTLHARKQNKKPIATPSSYQDAARKLIALYQSL